VHHIIGAVIIVAVCGYVGASLAGMCRIHTEQLEAFRVLIGHIGSRIDGFLSPLDEIFRSYCDKTLEHIGFFDAVAKYGCASALSHCRSRLYLSDNEYRELEAFFGGLGHGFAEEEIKHCRYYESRFSVISEKAGSELAKRSRLYRMLGLLSGVMIAVILL